MHSEELNQSKEKEKRKRKRKSELIEFSDSGGMGESHIHTH